MATERSIGGPLQRLYSERIGQPSTDDEALGYWVFALGAVLALAGFLLFVPSTTASGIRELAIVFGALGLPLMIAGPIIRLPLRRTATALVAAGVLACLAAVAWFAMVFPADWSLATGEQGVMGLYVLGIAAIAGGGIFVPLLTSAREDFEARAAALTEERDDALADEGDLARELEAMRQEHATHAAEMTDAQTSHGADMDDAIQDEEDLAAVLHRQGASQARFELFRGKNDEWRWRLRHRNGRIVADGAQGYSSRQKAVEGMRSVRRNGLGANTLLLGPDEEPPEPGEGFEPSVETDGERTFAPFDARIDDVTGAFGSGA